MLFSVLNGFSECLITPSINFSVMEEYKMLMDKDMLSTQLAMTHMLADAWYTPALSAVDAWNPKMEPVKSALGLPIRVTRDPTDGVLRLANSKIVASDLTCSNGVLHEVSRVVHQTSY